MVKPDSVNKKVQTTSEIFEVIAVERIEKETNPPDAVENFDMMTDLFPDPSEFGPGSPDFMFPPLPPTPPELDETETITSSTILKTAIEVLPKQLEEKKKTSSKKDNNSEVQKENPSVSKKSSKNSEDPKKTAKADKQKSEKKSSILIDNRKSKSSNREGKRHKKEDFSHLKVPQVQLQVSSEREIVDSIVVIKNKAERKEEKLASRKSKRKKEKKDQDDQQHLINCKECQEERIRKRREREMIRSDDIGFCFSFIYNF